MPLTVADVLAMPNLELRLLAGRDGLTNQVRWAHVTELADPVPWLRGGELVMTVGLGLSADPGEQVAYVGRLAQAGCAGLAFALDERLSAVPPAVLEEADRRAFPVLEVTGTTPFIAVAEAVAQWHADERIRGERRTVAAQEAMARAAVRGGAPGILGALAAHTGGETLLLDPRGRVRAARPDLDRDWHATAIAAVAGGTADRRRAIAIDQGEWVLSLQSLGFSGPPRGWLALWCRGPLEWHVRMLANQAACLLAIELIGAHRTRARAHAQRAALLASVLDADPASRASAAERLAAVCPVVAPPYEVMVVRARDGAHAALADAALDALADVLGDPATEELTFVCPRPDGLVLVVPESSPRHGPALYDRIAAVAGREVAAGACRASGLAEIATAVTHAAAIAARGRGYGHVDDLEPWALLRDALDPAGASRFAEAVLQPLREHDAQHGTALVSTVHTFLDCGQNLERAAGGCGSTATRSAAGCGPRSGSPAGPSTTRGTGWSCGSRCLWASWSHRGGKADPGGRIPWLRHRKPLREDHSGARHRGRHAEARDPGPAGPGDRPGAAPARLHRRHRRTAGQAVRAPARRPGGRGRPRAGPEDGGDPARQHRDRGLRDPRRRLTPAPPAPAFP